MSKYCATHSMKEYLDSAKRDIDMVGHMLNQVSSVGYQKAREEAREFRDENQRLKKELKEWKRIAHDNTCGLAIRLSDATAENQRLQQLLDAGEELFDQQKKMMKIGVMESFKRNEENQRLQEELKDAQDRNIVLRGMLEKGASDGKQTKRK